ncbi:protein toll isoform X2 [Tribolium castaneum]|uniref:protein toll isoform X2 n=1 Tax=Tribolium castaneum TaxID=7070 RepID=UPI00046C0F2F|nr:PREDICTED: protein toll isoform X2 [Tribolium castaneum]|eukprot:XP_008200932.1 PREDICTED: protein toll isoform X2 [Tribolium castaneum]
MRQILWLITFCTILKFAFCEIICNDPKGSCGCLGRRVLCSTAKTDDIIIDISKGIIDMECPRELKQLHFEKPPNVTIDSDISKFTMRYCPLPPNNFREIFAWFSLQNVETFEFYASELNACTLTNKYFQSLENLKQLILSDNAIDDLDENFFTNMPQVKLLDLKNNRIKLTKSTFKNLQFLQHLDLSSNNIKFVPHGAFQELETLTTLNLFDNQLTKIDDFTFAGLSNLQSLELSANKIQTISENAFATLKNLTRINLSNNFLKTLPGGLFQGNRNLKTLRLKHNIGLQLPGLVFANLFLTEVDLTKCRLGEIPENVFENTTTLKVVELGGNDLEDLPENVFKGLTNLGKISLQHNKIKSISHLFKGLERITLLQLQKNSIEKIESEAFADLINLEKINLRGNRIKQINPLVFSRNHKLKTVVLADNEIVDKFEEAITSTQTNNLIRWNLRHNRIQQIKLANWKNVSITLDYNPLICNCLNYNLLNHIRNQTRSNNLTITAKNVKCEGSQVFENLELSSLTCSLDEISKNYLCPKNCSCIWRPFDASVVINCSNKSLVKYPQVDLSQLTYVYNDIELHLENNKLESGPERRFGFLNITKLFLSNNTIRSIDWVPPRLKSLHLDKNRISKIPPKVIEVLKQTTLVNLTLNDNPWMCDCGAEILAQFLRTFPPFWPFSTTGTRKLSTSGFFPTICVGLVKKIAIKTRSTTFLSVIHIKTNILSRLSYRSLKKVPILLKLAYIIVIGRLESLS